MHWKNGSKKLCLETFLGITLCNCPGVSLTKMSEIVAPYFSTKNLPPSTNMHPFFQQISYIQSFITKPTYFIAYAYYIHNTHYTMHTTQYKLHNAHYTMHTAQCPLHNGLPKHTSCIVLIVIVVGFLYAEQYCRSEPTAFGSGSWSAFSCLFGSGSGAK